MEKTDENFDGIWGQRRSGRCFREEKIIFMKKTLVLDQRELKEIQHSLYYFHELKHGTVGHNLLMLVGKMADAMGFMLVKESGETKDILMFEGDDIGDSALITLTYVGRKLDESNPQS